MSNAPITCAELGQCHNGSVQLAKDMIYRLANPIDPEAGGIEKPWTPDAVKTQKRDLDDGELSKSAAEMEYTDPEKSFAYNSGAYAEHRKRLELSWSGQYELYEYAHEQDLKFIITLCAASLVDQMPFEPDALKVASRDLTNTPLLEALADTGLPIILSTGMATEDDLANAVDLIEDCGGNLHAILGCTSSYPCDFADAHLRQILWLKDRYGDRYKIGYSDHTQGVQAGAWATILGAEWLELHVTASRALKGGDHLVSLDIASGAWRYLRNVAHAAEALGERGLVLPDSVQPAKRKLERSVAAEEKIEPGTVVGSSNTKPLSADPDGFLGTRWRDRDEVFGKPLREDEVVEPRTVISSTMVENVNREFGEEDD